MTDIASMTDEELMTAWTETGTQVAALRERLKEFSAEHQRRTHREQLARAASFLSEEDMALLQEMRAEGVESGEHVGEGDEG